MCDRCTVQRISSAGCVLSPQLCAMVSMWNDKWVALLVHVGGTRQRLISNAKLPSQFYREVNAHNFV